MPFVQVVDVLDNLLAADTKQKISAGSTHLDVFVPSRSLIAWLYREVLEGAITHLMP